MCDQLAEDVNITELEHYPSAWSVPCHLRTRLSDLVWHTRAISWDVGITEAEHYPPAWSVAVNGIDWVRHSRVVASSPLFFPSATLTCHIQGSDSLLHSDDAVTPIVVAGAWPSSKTSPWGARRAGGIRRRPPAFSDRPPPTRPLRRRRSCRLSRTRTTRGFSLTGWRRRRYGRLPVNHTFYAK
jgi:hypothetical protein